MMDNFLKIIGIWFVFFFLFTIFISINGDGGNQDYFVTVFFFFSKVAGYVSLVYFSYYGFLKYAGRSKS